MPGSACNGPDSQTSTLDHPRNATYRDPWAENTGGAQQPAEAAASTCTAAPSTLISAAPVLPTSKHFGHTPARAAVDAAARASAALFRHDHVSDSRVSPRIGGDCPVPHTPAVHVPSLGKSHHLSERKQCHVSDLGQELLVAVLSHLGDAAALAACREVCWPFLTAANTVIARQVRPPAAQLP